MRQGEGARGYGELVPALFYGIAPSVPELLCPRTSSDFTQLTSLAVASLKGH